jgi:S1-C subfamily serine protease
MTDLTPELRDRINADPDLSLKVDRDEGVLVMRVMDGTPAEAAGIQPGDIIIAMNDKPIETASDVQQAVEATAIGEMLTLEINRDGETRQIQASPMSLPRDMQ